jgi:(p)ppGpp synthase/HD superfamily hydrolase
MEVVSILRYVGGVIDEDLLCVAALHDVVEQSDVAFSKIESRFGVRVRTLVQELTRREPSEEETAGMRADKIWKLRSSILLEEIGKMSTDAQQVKLADRLSNVRNALQTKIGGKLDRTLKQTDQILRIIPRSVNQNLWDAIMQEMRFASEENRSAVVSISEPEQHKPETKSLRKPIRAPNMKK